MATVYTTVITRHDIEPKPEFYAAFDAKEDRDSFISDAKVLGWMTVSKGENTSTTLDSALERLRSFLPKEE